MLEAGAAAGRGRFDVNPSRRVAFSVFGEYSLVMGRPYKGKARMMGVGVALPKPRCCLLMSTTIAPPGCSKRIPSARA